MDTRVLLFFWYKLVNLIKNNNQSLIDSGIQLVNIKDLSTL